MRPRGDDHDRDLFARPRDYGTSWAQDWDEDWHDDDDWDDDWEGSELESELARRLRNLSWPAPPPGLKERCLREILARMEENQEKKDEADESKQQNPPRGDGQHYALTRRAADVSRAPISMPPRPLRLAAVL